MNHRVLNLHNEPELKSETNDMHTSECNANEITTTIQSA